MFSQLRPIFFYFDAYISSYESYNKDCIPNVTILKEILIFFIFKTCPSTTLLHNES